MVAASLASRTPPHKQYVAYLLTWQTSIKLACQLRTQPGCQAAWPKHGGHLGLRSCTQLENSGWFPREGLLLNPGPLVLHVLSASSWPALSVPITLPPPNVQLISTKIIKDTKALSTVPGTDRSTTKLTEAQQAGEGEWIDFCSRKLLPEGGLGPFRWRNKHRGIRFASRALSQLSLQSSPDTHDLLRLKSTRGHLSYKYPFPFHTRVTQNVSILSGWGMGRERTGAKVSFLMNTNKIFFPTYARERIYDFQCPRLALIYPSATMLNPSWCHCLMS